MPRDAMAAFTDGRTHPDERVLSAEAHALVLAAGALYSANSAAPRMGAEAARPRRRGVLCAEGAQGAHRRHPHQRTSARPWTEVATG
jgi:hypothetical protein